MIDRERIEAIRNLLTTIHPGGPPYDATVLQREDRLLIRAFLADAECIVAALERSEARCERLRRERDRLFAHVASDVRWEATVDVMTGGSDPTGMNATVLAAHDREMEGRDDE